MTDTQRVLVTGGTSMIGRAVIDRLLVRGNQVTTMQRRPSPADEQADRPHLDEVLGDITDRDAVARAVDGHDAVIHLAAKVGVAGPRAEYESVNVGGTRSVLAAARSAGVARVVHVSSPSVAHSGEPLVAAPTTPADPTTTRGHYSTTKAEAELIALDANGTDLAVTAIRPHLVWGPGDEQLVGRMVDRARSGRLALIGSGGALIDTTYVDNAADALVAALDRCDRSGVAGQAFVVSNGQPRTVAELVERILLAAGLDRPKIRVPIRLAFAGGLVAERIWDRTGRTDDPPMTSFLAEQLSTAHWFDQRRTRTALEWTPAVDLDEGFRRLSGWFSSGSQLSSGGR